jgi:MFS family permease
MLKGISMGQGDAPYYGWYVAAACSAVAFITWGVGIFNQGVFLSYLVDQYGWSRATLSIGPMLFQLWAGIVGIAVGRTVDRHGPRLVLVVGAALLALGTIAFAWVRQPWHTFPIFLLLGTGFACIHTITLGKIVARWFVRYRARAMAIATLGASVGGTLLVPLNAVVLEHWGLAAGGITLAAITMGLIVPLAVWVVKEGPEAVGAYPDGAATATTKASGEASNDDAVWTVPEAMRTRAFWALTLSFSLGMIAQGGYLVHQMMFLQLTFGLLGAASIVTVTTIAGTVGRLGFAVYGHLWQPRHLSSAMLLLQAVSFILLASGYGPWSLIAGSALFGFTMGLMVMLHPLATANCFGQKTFGRIYGPVYLGIRIGAAFGPLLMGLLYAQLGSYRPVWISVATTLGLAAVGIQWATPLKRRCTAHVWESL